nr:DUF4145 domain-containing protein [Massilia sp. DJPM01]
MFEECTFHQNASTQQCWNEDWFDAEHAQYIFSGLLKCLNCNEFVLITGDAVLEEDYESNVRSYYHVIRPLFFHPPLRIIEPVTNGEIPKIVISHLNLAFQNFWSDADACVNRLRTIVEHLLDDLKVPRVHARKGNRAGLSDRIGWLIDPRYLNIKEAMKSLRYMGNEGSHGSDGIHREDLISAFVVINYCLEQLYPKINDHAEVFKIVAEVNLNEGFSKNKKL